MKKHLETYSIVLRGPYPNASGIHGLLRIPRSQPWQVPVLDALMSLSQTLGYIPSARSTIVLECMECADARILKTSRMF